MITAVEALKLPTAQLTAEEQAAADKLERAIEEHVLSNMSRGGCDVTGKETNAKVLAEVNQRLMLAGWKTNWQKLVEKNRFNHAVEQAVGFYLGLSPSEDAYRATLLQ